MSGGKFVATCSLNEPFTKSPKMYNEVWQLTKVCGLNNVIKIVEEAFSLHFV